MSGLASVFRYSTEARTKAAAKSNGKPGKTAAAGIRGIIIRIYKKRNTEKKTSVASTWKSVAPAIKTAVLKAVIV
jgi:hypothetical protein